MRKIHSTISLSFLVLFSGIAHADIVSITGDASSSIENSGSSFTGLVDYQYNSGNTGTLTITLTNTTPEVVGGFLTGFVFDLTTSDLSASISLFSATNAFFLDTGNETASPFGTFDAGAALNANWAGGGNPSDGIPSIIGAGPATTEIFIFDISALDANILSASSFLGDDGDWFAVRYRGLSNGGSDKLLLNIVPTPSVLLTGICMLGVGSTLRPSRKRNC